MPSAPTAGTYVPLWEGRGGGGGSVSRARAPCPPPLGSGLRSGCPILFPVRVGRRGGRNGPYALPLPRLPTERVRTPSRTIRVSDDHVRDACPCVTSSTRPLRHGRGRGGAACAKAGSAGDGRKGVWGTGWLLFYYRQLCWAAAQCTASGSAGSSSVSGKTIPLALGPRRQEKWTGKLASLRDPPRYRRASTRGPVKTIHERAGYPSTNHRRCP